MIATPTIDFPHTIFGPVHEHLEKWNLAAVMSSCGRSCWEVRWRIAAPDSISARPVRDSQTVAIHSSREAVRQSVRQGDSQTVAIHHRLKQGGCTIGTDL